MTVGEKKERILNALIERKGLQYLMDTISDVLNNPFFIYDISGKILAKSQGEESNQVWKELFLENGLQSENVQITEKAGIYKKILEDDIPVLGDFSYSPYRFLGCRIRDKEGAVGIATIVEKNPLKKEDYELLVISCKTILYEMLYREKIAMQVIPYFGLFKDIIEDNSSANELLERAKILQIDFSKCMRMIAIRHWQIGKNGLTLYFVREKLMDSVPQCYSVIYQDYLLIVIEESCVNDDLMNILRKLFVWENSRIGISRSFVGISGVKKAFSEICAIQSVSRRLHLNTPVVYYEDIILEHFMEKASKEMDLKEYCSPLLSQMEEYDRKHGTVFSQSVEAYLEASRNIQRASEKMHIHKNTLYYRLKRAEEIFGFYLDDENLCFTLQFSFRVRHMMDL